MTTSPVCVPLSSSRSMNSLLVSASASSKVGCDTCESSASARPAAPHEGPGLAITPAQIKQRHDPPDQRGRRAANERDELASS
jgi:hypothetical protein